MSELAFLAFPLMPKDSARATRTTDGNNLSGNYNLNSGIQ